jgi:hypothetical protein
LLGSRAGSMPSSSNTLACNSLSRAEIPSSSARHSSIADPPPRGYRATLLGHTRWRRRARWARLAAATRVATVRAKRLALFTARPNAVRKFFRLPRLGSKAGYGFIKYRPPYVSADRFALLHARICMKCTLQSTICTYCAIL